MILCQIQCSFGVIRKKKPRISKSLSFSITYPSRFKGSLLSLQCSIFWSNFLSKFSTYCYCYESNSPSAALSSAPTIAEITCAFLLLHSRLISLLGILYEKDNLYFLFKFMDKKSNISYLFIFLFSWHLQVSIDWENFRTAFNYHH